MLHTLRLCCTSAHRRDRALSLDRAARRTLRVSAMDRAEGARARPRTNARVGVADASLGPGNAQHQRCIQLVLHHVPARTARTLVPRALPAHGHDRRLRDRQRDIHQHSASYRICRLVCCFYAVIALTIMRKSAAILFALVAATSLAD